MTCLQLPGSRVTTRLRWWAVRLTSMPVVTGHQVADFSPNPDLEKLPSIFAEYPCSVLTSLGQNSAAYSAVGNSAQPGAVSCAGLWADSWGVKGFVNQIRTSTKDWWSLHWLPQFWKQFCFRMDFLSVFCQWGVLSLLPKKGDLASLTTSVQITRCSPELYQTHLRTSRK